MTDKASDNSANYVQLNRLADEFAARYRAGERPGLQEYIDRHPELAEDIRELFPAMTEIEQVKEDHQVAAEEATAPPSPALQKLGDFRIIREIGKGGMGTVYEAEQMALGRYVALKVLPKAMLPDAKAKLRFEREAKSAAKLHHTNIVPVFGVGEQDGLPYYVMQFIQGLGLDEVLEELKKLQHGGAKTGTFIGGELRLSRNAGQVSNLHAEERPVQNRPHVEMSAVNVARSLLTGEFNGAMNVGNDEDKAIADGVVATTDQGADAPRSPPSSDSFTLSSSSVVLPGRPQSGSKSKNKKQTYWQSVASIGVQVAEALEYAHKQGIQHRDIKPSNLLLDTRGTVWVTDFGLAKVDDQQNLTHTGDILGTLRYMPPEAFDGKTDARSDVYSLGLTLYEMLALRPAFDETRRNRLIKQVTHEEPPRLRKLNRQVPQDIQTIVHKAIDKDPKQRYASAGALAEDLQRFIADEPIRARRVSATERLWRWCRRNTAVAAMAAAFLVALIGGLIGVTTQWLRAEQHAEEARDNEGRAKANAAEAQDKEAEATRERDVARALNEQLRRVNYAVQINLAQAAWEKDNIGRMRELLDQQRPKTGEADLRNFEWHYLQHLCHGEKQTVPIGKTPDHMVTRLSLSHDGTRLAALLPEDGSDDYRAKVWDTATGKVLLAIPLAEQPGMLPTAVLSRDGKRLVTLQATWKEGKAPPADLRIFEIASGKEIHAQPLAGVNAGSGYGGFWGGTSLSFTADGKRLVLPANGDYNSAPVNDRPVELIILEVLTGKKVLSIPGRGRFRNPLFSSDGRRVAAILSSQDQKSPSEVGASKVQVWDAATGEELRPINAPKAFFRDFAFSPDGKRVATIGGPDYQMDIQLWNADNGEELLKIPTSLPPGWAQLVCSPDGKLLACCGNSPVVKVWDTVTGKLRQTLKGHTKPVQALAFDSLGRWLYSAGLDGTVKVWEIMTQEESSDLNPKPSTAFRPEGAISPDGTRVARVESPESFVCAVIDFLDTAGKVRFPAPLPTGGTNPLNGMAFSADGRSLAFTWWSQRDKDGPFDAHDLHVLDATTGKPRFKKSAGDETEFNSVGFSPDGSQVACSYNVTDRKSFFPAINGAKVWDASTGKELQTLRSRLAGWPAGVAFSPNGAWIAMTYDSMSRKGQPPDVNSLIVVWDVANGKELCTLQGHANGFDLLTFGRRDGKWIAASSSTSGPTDIEVWDFDPSRPETRKAPKYILKGHSDQICSLASSPDGRRIVSAAVSMPGASGELKIWDADTGQELLTLKASGIDLSTVCFSQDGNRLLALRLKSAGLGNPLRTWDGTPLPEITMKVGS